MRTATHVEIETKFDADDDVDVKDLTDVLGVAEVTGPVEQDLDARYFDTADLRLLRAGIGLRRRTGGDDSGWHLKIERAVGERLEVRRPLGRSPSRVPKALRELITVHVRDLDLAPVARLRTHRRVHRLVGATGDVVAEVADDEVCGEVVGAAPATWRELEVELVGGGDRDLLAAVERHLRALGATPAATSSKLARALADDVPADNEQAAVDKSSTAGAVAAAYLRAQTAAVLAVDPAVRLDVDDAVHKMRVAVRRLRSALAIYRRLLDGDVAEPLRDELKWLGGVLGAVRDTEVIRDHLQAALSEQPAPFVVGPVRRRIGTTLDAEHRDARRRVLAELSSPRYLALIDAITHLDEAVCGKRATKPARKVLTKELRRTHRRMRRVLDAAVAGSPPSDEQLHDVRKATKRMRYAAESVTDVFGSTAKALAEQMEDGQEILGAHQDSVVIRDVLRRLADAAAEAGEPSFTYGRMHAAEQHRGDAAAATFLALVNDRWAIPPSWLR